MYRKTLLAGIAAMAMVSGNASDPMGSSSSAYAEEAGKSDLSPAKDIAVPPSTVGLDVVCILDNSGSMQGSKLKSLKTAMEFVIQSLGPNDRYS